MKTIFFLCAIMLSAAITAQTTWYEISTGTDKKLNTIDFPSANVGYIGGNDSTLLKSTDAGQTWNAVTFTGVNFTMGSEHILTIDFVTETTGYMTAGLFGGVYKTTDGGLTWVELIPAGTFCYYDGLYFFNEQNGFIGGSGCFQGEAIDKMSSGTFTPATINHPTWNAADLVVDIDFLDNNFGLAASYSGNILRTTDGGISWDSIPSGQAEGIPLTSIAIIDDTLAYAGYNNLGSGFGILRTTDGGLTWAEDLASATFYYPAYLCLHQSGNGYVYSGAQPSFGNTGLIFESAGPGAWAYYDVDHPVNDMSSHSGSVVFGVGDSGYVVVNQPPSNLAINGNKVEDQSLFVYPNPVHDVLNIPAPADLNGEAVTLLIYSASGQLIFESRYAPDDVVDMSAFEPGLYILELRSAGSRQHTRVIKK